MQQRRETETEILRSARHRMRGPGCDAKSPRGLRVRGCRRGRAAGGARGAGGTGLPAAGPFLLHFRV